MFSVFSLCWEVVFVLWKCHAPAIFLALREPVEVTPHPWIEEDTETHDRGSILLSLCGDIFLIFS